ncbi:3-deoxy-D-manno-octulosonic acid transferase [Candidatus Pelagibacter sp.]|nr:3-deoxy-D-manno-octulosonic acid transferase [Candidatus Pelagibacter sp.]
MFFVYKILINIIFFFSPLILIVRLIKDKEDPRRFKEKLGFFLKKRKNGNLIWFHGASVGEIQSIIPLIEKFEKSKNINQILITSNTISSSKIIKKYKLKKTIHQFFPIDCDLVSRKFINYWKPSKVFFVDSEIWPNTINNLSEKKIPIILLNGRITKKTFDRWLFFPNFAQSLFNKFKLCLSSSLESKKYLKKLGAKRIKFVGNLKFSQSENPSSELNDNLKRFIRSRKSWCASSTHFNEEKFCGLVHIKLKKKYKNLLTIVIPRHVSRVKLIENELNNLNLKVHLDEPPKKISANTDIYLVNSYGKTKSFYKECKNVFLGGSLIKHGGQNPLEAVRYGCKVFHGPNISNFREIYEFLKNKNFSSKIVNHQNLTNLLIQNFKKKIQHKKIVKTLHLIGKNILDKTYKEIC